MMQSLNLAAKLESFDILEPIQGQVRRDWGVDQIVGLGPPITATDYNFALNMDTSTQAASTKSINTILWRSICD
ncbi:uncharacterized protein PHALS_13899 [Plasmopara halstedii]|uniref:Uncharacterized protein n=1 Tax=Plasmopara halstedii TaxID=4781 RepID=A0A0P1A3Z9_PLAHL|nr:uncharacterized protein PHALS_13899 [Plasmopara halstedii]CEG35143.1 hypothetical protein PHALS_13899 [Plasmopara halstedii]|eukprot:XP_024571512.1 hypothetical protein PHALS_13899 [Plasmopara halstedii]